MIKARKKWQFRKAGPLKIAKEIVNMKFNWSHQLFLIHSLTSRCNARCGFCAWNPDSYEPKSELSTEEIKKLYYDARQAGFIALSVWGGEPLVHRDIDEVLKYAYNLGFITSIVTNGALLERKMDKVLPYIHKIGISVDHPSEKHDEMRKIKGLYEKIINVTKRIRKEYPKKKIIFNYTVSKENVDIDTIDKMAKVMKSLGVLGIFNAIRVESATNNEELGLDKYNPSIEEQKAAFSYIKWLKEKGYPILNSNSQLDKLISGEVMYNCHWPKFFLPIEANGDVVDCQYWGANPIANIRDYKFSEILNLKRVKDLAGNAGEMCHKCVSIHRIEVSEMWEGKLDPIVNLARSGILK